MAHMRSLRFWRIWFEMASAVAVAVLLHSLLDSVWLAGLAATGIMAVVGFVIVGVSPRQLGRAHAAGVARVHRTGHPVPVLGAGPHSGVAGRPGKRGGSGRRRR